MLSRFDRLRERDGRTDGQTELLYQYRALVCWRAIKKTAGIKSQHMSGCQNASRAQRKASKQEAQLSQRGRSMLYIEYFAKSLKVIRNDTLE